MKKLISIVIPVYNEEEVIVELSKRLNNAINRILKYNFEIIMVENGSIDDSFDLLVNERKKNKKIKIIQIVKNVGTDGALIAGLSYAKGDAALVMMADLQEDPKLIPVFIDKWEKGYEIVYGIVKNRKKLGTVRKLETFFYYKFIKLTTNNLVIENASDFRLMDKNVYKLVSSLPEHDKFFRGLVNWTGFKQIGIEFDRSPRFAGESKAYFTTVLKVALNGIFSFTSILNYIPLLFSFISFLLFTILIFLHELFTAIETLLFSFVFLVLAIILEFLRRILTETRNRPQFIIREKIGF